MRVCCKQVGERARIVAFTLVECLISIVILALAMGGILYGYVRADDFAEWSSMSLAAQSLAAQGMEQARSAQWNSQQYPQPTASGPGDDLYVTNQPGAKWSTNLSGTNYSMDVPASGTPFFATNILTITTISSTPPLRMIRSDCVWTFPRTGITYTNTMVTYRAPDQ